VRRLAVRLLGLTAMFAAVGAIFAGTAFAGVGPPVGPFMPCCFNPPSGDPNNMACCINNPSMQTTCCKRFLS